jgi:tetratricopeptide (TPR) repeat protein
VFAGILFGTPHETALAEEPHGPAPASHPDIIEAMDIGGVDVRTGTLLLSGQEGGDVDGALWWTLGAINEKKQYDVHFVVEVEGLALLSGLEGDRIAIALLAYVVDDSQRIVDHIAQGVILDAHDYTDKLVATGLKFVGRASLDPGSYTLRVMVREQSTGHFFMVRSRLEMPAGEAGPSEMLPPTFRDLADTWVIVRQRGVTPGEHTGPLSDWIPAARPVLVEGRPSEFLVSGGNVDTASVVEVRLVDRAGRVVAEYPLVISEPGASDRGHRTVTLPGLDIPPGPYDLTLSTRAADDTQSARKSIRVVLVGSSASPTWVSHRQRVASSATSGDSGPQHGDFSRKKVREDYLAALNALASGDDLGARQRLGSLEKQAMNRDVLRSLRRIEDAVAAEVAAQDPLSLLPIALLHQQMVRRYTAHREFVLAAYSRAVTTDRAVEIGTAGVAAGFAEALLVSLASDLSRTASTSLSRELLEQALEFDSKYRPALLALGASLERAADYSKAINVFEHLVESDPGDEEGWLRLAVNHARLGHQRAAARSFRRISSSSTHAWIGILANQELARLMLENKSPDEALVILDDAIARYPTDQRLRILQSWVLDATGRSLDAVSALLAIPPAEHEDSPRLRYGEWPDLGAEVSATAIRRSAQAALASLESVLDADGPDS